MEHKRQNYFEQKMTAIKANGGQIVCDSLKPADSIGGFAL